ncbi:MAG: c-type cytochrome biogenesis protein CcmI [Rhodospirillaceae bacterium]
MIWIALALSVLVVAALVWPVFARSPSALGRAAYDLTVFQDQLKEVDRDVARGVLTDAEADAARLEIQRRILAVGRAPAEEITTGSRRSRWVALGVTGVAVPLIALGAYLEVGTPDPGAAQLAALESADGMSQSDMDALVDRLAARVASEPDNPDGYALLGRTYRELDRFAEAAEAFKRLVALQPSAEAYSSLGEALSAAQNGRVTEEAHAAMMNALALDRSDPRARFYLGLEQAGKGNPQGAIAIWRDLTGNAPTDAPWVDMVRQQMAALAQEANIAPMSVAPKHPLDLLPGAEKTIAAAKTAPAPPAPPSENPEQSKMIEGMVAGLAARLEQNPDDYDGWMMLGRSYTVLKQSDKAGEAYKKAIALKPKDVAPRLQYAGLLMMEVDPDAQAPLPAELSTTVAEILKLQPDHPEALYIAGLGRAKAGDVAGARGYWQKAHKAAADGSALRAEIDRRLQLLK